MAVGRTTDDRGSTTGGGKVVGPKGAEPELLRGVATRLLQLAALVRQGRSHSPEAEDQRSAFATLLGDCLAGGVPVHIDVSMRGLVYSSVEVSGSDAVSRVVCEGLHEHGLRAFSVEPSARRAELIDLANLLSTDWRGRAAHDDDLESVAWQLGFDNVHLDISGTQTVAEAEELGLGPEELVHRIARQLGASSFHEDEDALSDEVRGLMVELRRGESPRTEPSLPAGPGAEDWRAALKEIQAGDDCTDERVGLLLAEVIRTDRRPAGAAKATSRLVIHLRRALQIGQPAVAAALLRPALTFAEPDLYPPDAWTQAIREELGGLARVELRECVEAGWALNRDTEAWTGLLFSLGAALGVACLDDLARLAQVFPDREAKQALADGLALTLERDQLTLKELLHDAADHQLPLLLLTLRRRPDPTLLGAILARAHHADPVVREAVVLTLRDYQSPRTKELVRAAVTDSARGVRLEALRYLSVYRDAEAAPKVLDRLRTAGPDEVDETELRALAITVARITREKGMADLEKLAGGGARHPRAAAAALHGLRSFGAAGRVALERIGRSQPALRDEVRQLLGGPA